MIKCPLTRGARLREVSISGGPTLFLNFFSIAINFPFQIYLIPSFYDNGIYFINFAITKRETLFSEGKGV